MLFRSTVNLTVESSAEINFTTNNIDFGSGRVTAPNFNATLQSQLSGAATNGNWTQPGNGLVLKNIGNANVSITLSAGKTAAQFIGGTGPQYQWNVTNSVAGSCATANGCYTFGTFVATNSSNQVCDRLQPGSANALRIDVKLVVPADSYTGALGDIITATAVVNP